MVITLQLIIVIAVIAVIVIVVIIIAIVVIVIIGSSFISLLYLIGGSSFYSLFVNQWILVPLLGEGNIENRVFDNRFLKEYILKRFFGIDLVV